MRRVAALMILFGLGPSAAAAQPPPADLPRVVIETDVGTIELAIDRSRAPLTADNFLQYVAGRFYDGSSFYRTVTAGNQPEDVIRIAVIQGGVDGTRETRPAIPLERTSQTGLSHRDGVISMARNGPETATSEFFICVGDQPELDFGGRRNPDGQGFAAFGRVVEGMDVVREIHQRRATGQRLTPPVRINAVRLLPPR